MIRKNGNNSDVIVDDLQDVQCIISCSNSSPCKSCVGVTNLENAIDRLNMERCELKRNINRSHSQFIRLIPPEIIARISGFAIADFTTKGSLPAPILLSSVCSDWRRAVAGTPELWSSIKIDFPYIPQISDKARRTLLRLSVLIDEWLARSGQLPLYISLCSVLEEFHYPERPEEYSPIFKVLDRYSSRWHSLNISIPPFLISLLRPDCLPLLEQLYITSIHNPYTSITFPHTPRLNTVEIQLPRSDKGCSPAEYRMRRDIGIKWNTVTHLSVETPISSRYLYGLLRMNPQLVHCRFHDIIDDAEDQLGPPIISHLRYFSLLHESNPSRILNNIKLPSLETFVFLGVIIDPILTFLRRSACSLRTLSLLNWHPRKVDQLIPLLQFLSPSLTRLTISRRPSPMRATKSYLSLLTRIYTFQSEVVGNDFLPHLEVFEYRELEGSASKLESSMLSNLPSRNYPKSGTATISLRSAYINKASFNNKNIPSDISSILQRLEEEGILTYT